MTKQIASLPIGAKIKDATTNYYSVPIIWQIADINHSGYPENSVTLISEKILTLKCFDGKEPGNSDANRKSYGNNRYNYANLRQWLNSDAIENKWYVEQHSADAPPILGNTNGHNPYDEQAGFLNAFSQSFKDAMLETKVIVALNTVTDGGAVEIVKGKVFLSSNSEVGLKEENNMMEGVKLALFSDNSSRVAKPTVQAVSNSTYTSSSLNVNTGLYWWLRTPYASNSCYARVVNSGGTLNNDFAYCGNYGVRPLCNLKSTILVSDTTDADGCYTIVWNLPPSTPSTITVPEEIFSKQSSLIRWSSSVDPEGNTITYELERSKNGNEWTKIYNGSDTSFSDAISTEMNQVQYRVRALDSYGESSETTTSEIRTVIHNRPPSISGNDGDFGVKTDCFEYKYTVNDAESNETNVEEKVDGRTIKNYIAQLGQEAAMKIDDKNWVILSHGDHVLTITATDSQGAITVRTMTFIKKIDKLYASLENSLPSILQPKRINVMINAQIPAGASVLVEVCNNANDPNPSWENATDSTLAHHAHIFANSTKICAEWGVNIRVTIERKKAIGDCYITGIGGNFE